MYNVYDLIFFSSAFLSDNIERAKILLNTIDHRNCNAKSSRFNIITRKINKDYEKKVVTSQKHISDKI